MRSFFRWVCELNERFADSVSQITGWSAWVSLITVGTVIIMGCSYVVTRRFDFLGPTAAFWIFFLTVQTSIDSAAQRQNATALRRSDDKRDAQVAMQIEGIANLTIKISEELERSKARDDAMAERDMASAQRDEVLRELITQFINIVSEESP